MALREKKFQRVAISSTPSLLYNNLTAGGGRLSFVHHNTVTQATEASAVVPAPPGHDTPVAADTSKVSYKDTSIVYQARFCPLGAGGVGVLVLATGTGIQIFDGAGVRLLFSCPGPEGKGKGDGAHFTPAFTRGITSVMANDSSVQICVGSSVGHIQVISQQKDSFRISCVLEAAEAKPVVALASEFCGRWGTGSYTRGQLVSCDQEGTVVIWGADSASSYSKKLSIEGEGVPGVGLVCRGDLLVCALASGLVRFYSLQGGALRHELVAHSRWLSAIDVHPQMDWIATVAEDATVGVWSLPQGDGGKVDVLMSTSWDDHMLCGVAFFGERAQHLCLVAYDTDSARVYTM